MNLCPFVFEFNEEPIDYELCLEDIIQSPEIMIEHIASLLFQEDDEEFAMFCDFLIDSRDIVGIEMCHQALMFYRGDDENSTFFSSWLLRAAKYGNIETFKHCLYIYMKNWSSTDNSVYYPDLLHNSLNLHLICNEDDEVYEFVKDLYKISVDNKLPYYNCDFDNVSINDYQNKLFLYQQIISNY